MEKVLNIIKKDINVMKEIFIKECQRKVLNDIQEAIKNIKKVLFLQENYIEVMNIMRMVKYTEKNNSNTIQEVVLSIIKMDILKKNIVKLILNGNVQSIIKIVI